MRQLSYFVFTSGEQGIRELDWGIKFASSVLGDYYELDSRYRELLKEFNLSPELERPDSGVGLLVLTWRTSLMVFVFPSYDTMKRQNTVAIACNIPADLASSFSVREAARRIWSANDLSKISQHGVERPDVLIFPDEATPDGEYPFSASSLLMAWPTDERGYLSVNRNVRKLDRRQKVVPPPPPLDRDDFDRTTPRHSYKWIVAACVVAVCAGVFLMSISDDTPPEPPVVREVVKPAEPEVEVKTQPEIEVKPVSEDDKPVSPISLDTPVIFEDNEPHVKNPDVFEVDKTALHEALKRLYDTKKPSPEIKTRNDIPVLTFGTKKRFIEDFKILDIPTIFSGGTKFDKDEFVRSLEEKVTFNEEQDEARINFWENDEKLQKGKVAESFDVYLDIFIDQALEHFKPINGGE